MPTSVVFVTGFPRPQLGVLAFGTTHHAYLELDRPQLSPRALVAALRVVENAALSRDAKVAQNSMMRDHCSYATIAIG